MLESIIAFIGATALLAFSPGPDNIYVLTQSVANGRNSGLATTVGLVSGCIVHTTLVAFGLSAIIATSPTVFFIIKLLGAFISHISCVYGFLKVMQKSHLPMAHPKKVIMLYLNKG